MFLLMYTVLHSLIHRHTCMYIDMLAYMQLYMDMLAYMQLYMDMLAYMQLYIHTYMFA